MKQSTDEFGPAEAHCPHCGETFEVPAGPTKMCEVVHEPNGCGEWVRVNLETGGTCKARLP